jgi:hypothetical protein
MLNRPKSKSTKIPQVEEEHIDLAEYSDSSSEDESSGDEVEVPPVDINTLPAVAKDDAIVAQKLASVKKHQKKTVRCF